MSGGDGKGSPLDGTRDRGAGSVLALAAVAVTVTLTAAVVGVSGAWGARQRAAVAADAAALAAADIAVGRRGGDPCSQAEAVARADGAVIRACVIAGVIVTVEAAVPYHGWEASASARAGPPGSR
ncbi:Secretion/DNA translocation related TadE-like protein OS=Leifsonia shinshuensis OX=150026 GN=HNR13_003456 PE=4 SV=1 [Leifsonia shinshuensis]